MTAEKAYAAEPDHEMGLQAACRAYVKEIADAHNDCHEDLQADLWTHMMNKLQKYGGIKSPPEDETCPLYFLSRDAICLVMERIVHYTTDEGDYPLR